MRRELLSGASFFERQDVDALGWKLRMRESVCRTGFWMFLDVVPMGSLRFD